MVIKKDIDRNTPIQIYVLIDPRDNIIRYVGWTSKTLNERLKKHLEEINSNKNNHRINWLRQLHKLDIIPIIKNIENTIYNDRVDREKYWIAYYGRENLVNGTDGGEGTLGIKRSSETLKKMSENQKEAMKSDIARENLRNKAKQQWKNNRESLLISLKNKTMPPSWIINLRNRIMPDTWIPNLSKALSGNKNPMYGKMHTEEAKEKIRESRKRNPNSKRGIKQKNSTSEYLGVYKDKERWCSVLILSKKRYNLGRFSEETFCAMAYDIASLYFYGLEYKLNFPNSRQFYIDQLNKYEINDIKDLRKVIKLYLETLQ